MISPTRGMRVAVVLSPPWPDITNSGDSAIILKDFEPAHLQGGTREIVLSSRRVTRQVAEWQGGSGFCLTGGWAGQ
jgi:hypothetical protein